MKTNKIFIAIVITQVAVIAFLGSKIWNSHQQPKVLGINVSPINQSSIQKNASTSAELLYFYEPIPSQIVTDTVPGSTKNVQYQINSDSLNSLREYSIKKDPSTFRIITLGDSFTFGQFVNTKNNYPTQLENLLNNLPLCPKNPKIEVINLGERGYDLRYSVERYQKRGQKYDPDLVIWLVKDDDFLQIYELLNESHFRLLQEGYPEFDPESKRWIAINLAVEEMNQKYSKEFVKKYQIEALKLIRSYFQKKIIFISMVYTETANQTLLEYVSSDPLSLQYPLITIQDSDRFIDTHPNERGNLKIAQFISQILRKDILNCQF